MRARSIASDFFFVLARWDTFFAAFGSFVVLRRKRFGGFYCVAAQGHFCARAKRAGEFFECFAAPRRRVFDAPHEELPSAHFGDSFDNLLGVAELASLGRAVKSARNTSTLTRAAKRRRPATKR